MPVVTLNRADLEQMVGKDAEAIVAALPLLGADVECVNEEIEVEFFPNRPDLFSVEGAARAVRGILGVETGLPHYVTTPSEITLTVDPSVNVVRPYVVCAVMRGVSMNDRTIKSLIELQEDLHWGIGRDRRKASIGIHDLSRVRPPFRYTVGETPFVPLELSDRLTPAEILRVHPKGKEYAHLVGSHHPLILDSGDRVLSFPPIINGELTRVTDTTTDLFIDVTGREMKAIQDCLHILVTALSDRGARIETVEVAYHDANQTLKTPTVEGATHVISRKDVERRIGTDLDERTILTSLAKVRMDAQAKDDLLSVTVPCYRTDIMHPVDIIEDVAIGFGYERIPSSYPKLGTIGKRLEEEHRATLARDVLQGLGFIEVITLMLASESTESVIIENPILEEHVGLRTSLLPGLIGTLSLNQHRDYPQMLYEVGGVARILDTTNVEERLFCSGVIASTEASFTEIKRVVSALLREFNIDLKVIESTHPTFIEGRRATILAKEQAIGTFGEVDPDVLTDHKLVLPVAAFELNIQT
ncbi:MAG: phenylalanine--tRNA ligase subunit beta [Halobacteriota archaeon]